MVTIKMAALSNKIEMPQSLIDENIHALLRTIDYYYTYSSISYDDNNAWSKLLRSVDVLIVVIGGRRYCKSILCKSQAKMHIRNLQGFK